MSISKEMKEHIGTCYVSALDISPEVRLISTRRLLTLLSGAVNINNDVQNKSMILDCINKCEEAIALYAEDEQNWGNAMWICNKILDKVTPMIYSGYGTIKESQGFSLASTQLNKGET